jgi:5-methylcytosine-specific restriction endonuclease McrA
MISAQPGAPNAGPSLPNGRRSARVDNEQIATFKTCSKCRQEKPAERRYFSTGRRGKFGLHSVCLECCATAAYARYIRKRAERPTEHWFVCTDCGVATQRMNSKQKRCSGCQTAHRRIYSNRYKKRPDQVSRIRETTRNYRDANRDRVRHVFAVWSLANRDHLCAKARKYRAENVDRVKHHRRVRRARERNASGGHTAAEFVALCESYGWCCAYCGVFVGRNDITADHKTPLSKGGSDDIGNIAPACRTCNNRKYNRTAEEFAALA